MRFTLIRRDKDNRMHVTMKTADAFMERIKTDTKSGDVTALRYHLEGGSASFTFPQIHRLPRVYPSAELTLDANSNLTMRCMNGVVLLSTRKIRDGRLLEQVKQKAMMMPTTLAAFTGSSGQSVKVLVCIGLAAAATPGNAANCDGTLPQDEEAANRFLAAAFAAVKAPYQALLGVPLDDSVPLVTSSFRMTLDPQPLYNPRATPFTVNMESAEASLALAGGTAALPEEQRDSDMDLYTQYEHVYSQAAERIWEHVGSKADSMSLLAELGRQLCLAGMPEEEAVAHAWSHYRYKMEPSFSEERIRAVISASYAETKPPRQGAGAIGAGLDMRRLMAWLQGRYVFRYNTVMGYTEYRPNNSGLQNWKPVDERVVNGFTTDARLAGIDVWDRDVSRFVKSDKIRPFNPVADFLWRVQSKWDGTDHIGRLAATVPTDCEHWTRWFRTWLLAMVAQWKGLNRRYGNAVAPLLISRQGYNKSTFCRSLLPDELQWGYTDNLSLDEKRPVLQAMSQMLLINLDEFNQISARTQEGFLKNVIQLARVKAKRPYGKHVEDFPRMASFIATTNMTDVLADPSGCRRFIGVELTGPIDVSLRPNHEQLYAQAQVLLEQGEPYWFDNRETQLIMRHNRQFERHSPAEQCFHELFVAAGDGDSGQWLTTAAIWQRMKSTFGTVLRQANLVAFGRMLSNVEGLQRRHGLKGTEYYVLER